MSDEKFPHRTDAALRLAELRSGGKPAAEAADAPLALEIEEGDESFSTISADRQQKLMVVLRMKDGNVKARAYSYLFAIDFDPSVGIVLHFSGCKVEIAGWNLEPLLAGLVTHRVAVVPEVDELYAEAGLATTTTVVTRIKVTDAVS